MSNEYVLTTDDNGDLAVRTVTAEESPTANSTDIITATTDGKLAVRVVGNGGGGSGDSHNKGYFATPEALRTAYPTAQPGDFAIVESTDTVWVWDSDTNDWKDGDTKGQVTSVNNQTGAVTVQETLVSGTNIKTVDGNSLLGSGNLELSTYLPFPNGWTTTGTTKALCDDIAADTTAVEGKAYLGEVTFSDLPASMANGEVVVEIMDGTTAQNKVIVLTLTSGNTAPYMWKYTYWNGGSDVSGWKTWATAAQGAKADTAVQPADLATVATTGAYSDLSGTPTIPDPTQVSTLPTASADELGNIYQFIGTTDANYTNGYFYKCVSDGQTPATYSWTAVEVQASSGGLPTQTGNAGKFLTTDGTDASWAAISALQNTATGVGSLTILGTASTGSYATNIGVNSNNLGGGVSIGYGASSTGSGGICIGQQTSASSYNSIAIGTSSSASAMNAVSIGRSAQATAQYAIQLGAYGNSGTTNSDANTFKVGNANGNYEMMSADGTIPEARLADMTNAAQGQVLTLDSNNNAVWATPGGGGGGSATATTATLAANAWSSNSQTVNVTGVTSSNIVFVMPAPATQGAYNRADIQCTAQGSGTLTFTCGNVPTTAITVNIIIM